MKTATKERPILFQPRMAELAHRGLKTQTRRLIPGTVLDKWTGRDEHLIDLVNAGHQRYGQPGDRLWVREAWGYKDQFYSIDAGPTGGFVYKANGSPDGCHGEYWLPSIHMPRAACRTILEITAVKVERVRSISREDIIAEGFATATEFFEVFYGVNKRSEQTEDPWVWCISFRKVPT